MSDTSEERSDSDTSDSKSESSISTSNSASTGSQTSLTKSEESPSSGYSSEDLRFDELSLSSFTNNSEAISYVKTFSNSSFSELYDPSK